MAATRRHTATYLLKCLPEQRRSWQEKAAASGMTLAQWIRAALDSTPGASVSYTTVSSERKQSAIESLIRLLQAEKQSE